MQAARVHGSASVDALLSAGAHVAASNVTGSTALHLACMEAPGGTRGDRGPHKVREEDAAVARRAPPSQRGTIARLLAAGADVNAVTATARLTPAMFAVDGGELEALRALLAHDKLVRRASASASASSGPKLVVVDWKTPSASPPTSGLLAFILKPASARPFLFPPLSTHFTDACSLLGFSLSRAQRPQQPVAAPGSGGGGGGG